MDNPLRDLDQVVILRDAVVENASKPPTKPCKKSTFSKAQCVEAINAVQPNYTPPILVTERNWSLRNPKQTMWSPLRLFLLMFGPVFDLLLYHTNSAMKRSKPDWKPVTMIELRRWLACRLEIYATLSDHSNMNRFWSLNTVASRYLSKYCGGVDGVEPWLGSQVGKDAVGRKGG